MIDMDELKKEKHKTYLYFIPAISLLLSIVLVLGISAYHNPTIRNFILIISIILGSAILLVGTIWATIEGLVKLDLIKRKEKEINEQFVDGL